MTDDSKENKRWVDFSIIGLMFPTSIAVGLAIGYFLDRWLHTAPYLLIIFTLYGVVAGFYHLFRMTRQNGKK
jgi:ATP synthase protein I